MANVTRFDPFQISGLDPFDDVFKGFFRPVRMEGRQEVLIKMDIKEDDKAYTVHAQIPGVKKEWTSMFHRWQSGVHQRRNQTGKGSEG